MAVHERGRRTAANLAFEPLTARTTPADGDPLPTFVLRPVVIPVEGIEVTVDRDDPEDPESVPAIERSVGRSAHVLAGARPAKLEEVSASFEAAVRPLGAGVRVRSMRSLTCVQAGRSGGSCLLPGPLPVHGLLILPHQVRGEADVVPGDAHRSTWCSRPQVRSHSSATTLRPVPEHPPWIPQRSVE